MDPDNESYQATANFIIPKRKTYFKTKETIMRHKLPQKCPHISGSFCKHFVKFLKKKMLPTSPGRSVFKFT